MSKFVIEYSYNNQKLDVWTHLNSAVSSKKIKDSYQTLEDAFKAAEAEYKGFKKFENKTDKENNQLYVRNTGDSYVFRIRKIRTKDDEDWSVGFDQVIKEVTRSGLGTRLESERA